MFHANWTREVHHKAALLARARRIITRGRWSSAINNFSFGPRRGRRARRSIAALLRQERIPTHDRNAFVRPSRVALDLSTACQLKCPSCPTATGVIGKGLGTGFLKLADFERFLHEHPWVRDIELSNWGEVFLNKDVEAILEVAHRRGVALRVDNGANLDRVSDRVLEAIVKYELRSLCCSIDGASQQVYGVYRVHGELDRVIGHIRRINAYKRQYRSPYPSLRWQYVAFGHNEHEIGKARKMARALGMQFYLKLSWDDLYGEAFSRVRDRRRVERESALGVADRHAYEEKFGLHYVAQSCHQLWLRPRINFDGRVLGCSINHWDDFGNVFTQGLEASLAGEKMQRTKEMLMGLAQADPGSPCLRCQIYLSRCRKGAWVKPQELVQPAVPGA
jgi:MoaA/NifB/PqqE/SkfB family radical SAM enzyme